MTRRLVLILSAYSLLTGVMLVAVCVRGQSRADSFWWQSTDQAANTWRGLNVETGKSGVYLLWLRYDFEVPGAAARTPTRVQ